MMDDGWLDGKRDGRNDDGIGWDRMVSGADARCLILKVRYGSR